MAAYKILRGFIAAVWFVNGLYCKILGRVPRHRAIVSRILGESHAGPITRGIGIAEVSMVVWIVSGIAPRLNALTQIAVVAAMNVLEFILAPDLLLWGKLNSVFASGFISAIYYGEFILRPRSQCSPIHPSPDRGSHA